MAREKKKYPENIYDFTITKQPEPYKLEDKAGNITYHKTRKAAVMFIENYMNEFGNRDGYIKDRPWWRKPHRYGLGMCRRCKHAGKREIAEPCLSCTMIDLGETSHYERGDKEYVWIGDNYGDGYWGEEQ